MVIFNQDPLSVCYSFQITLYYITLSKVLTLHFFQVVTIEGQKEDIEINNYPFLVGWRESIVERIIVKKIIRLFE